MFVIISSQTSHMISLYSVRLIFPDYSEVGMKSEAKENFPAEPGKERKDYNYEDRLAAPVIDDDQRQKFSQNETEPLSETIPGGGGTITSTEDSLLGKRSFPGEINENASGGTPDRPGRPSVPTPSKGRVVFSTIKNQTFWGEKRGAGKRRNCIE